MLADARQAQALFIQQLGAPTPYFAYPYGAFTPALDAVLRAAGYRYFFTIWVGLTSPAKTRTISTGSTPAPPPTPKAAGTPQRCTIVPTRRLPTGIVPAKKMT